MGPSESGWELAAWVAQLGTVVTIVPLIPVNLNGGLGTDRRDACATEVTQTGLGTRGARPSDGSKVLSGRTASGRVKPGPSGDLETESEECLMCDILSCYHLTTCGFCLGFWKSNASKEPEFGGGTPAELEAGRSRYWVVFELPTDLVNFVGVSPTWVFTRFGPLLAWVCPGAEMQLDALPTKTYSFITNGKDLLV